MFKRRPLNKDKTAEKAKPAAPAAAPKLQAPAQASPPQQNRPQGQRNQQGQNQRPQGQSQRQGQRHHRPPQGQRGPQQQGQQGQQAQGQPQGQGAQNQNRNQNRNKNRNNRNRRGGQDGQRRPQRPQPPPAYLQRDILLIATKDVTKTIEEVRLRFDPLSKKLPVHITLLFPEPAAKVTNDLLKKIDVQSLPSLKTLTFTSIEIFDEFYLWLMPDKDSGEKISAWHAEFAKHIPENTQEEKYIPHITLGYVPRNLPDDEAVVLAKNIITTPLTIDFETLLLEEFSEDQNSKSLDRLQILL
jgi:2'-5' RNA ligase